MTTPESSRRGAAWILLALAAPAILVAVHPSFHSQDDPAHLLNARILLIGLTGAASPFGDVYVIEPTLAGNWAGHLLGMAAVAIGSWSWSARLYALATLLAIPLGAWSLRREVRGDAPAFFVLLAALLGMNWAWISGFASFELSLVVALAGCAAWWRWRESHPRRAGAALAIACVLAYCCHVVGLAGLAGMVMVVELLDCAWSKRRPSGSLLGLLAIAPLMALYMSAMSGGGHLSLRSIWKGTLLGSDDPVRQLLDADPLSIAAKKSLPFGDVSHPLAMLASPAALLLVAVAILGFATLRRGRACGPWPWCAVVMIAAALLGPERGVGEGAYITQRVLLLALLVVAATAQAPASRLVRGGVTALLAVALALQVAHLARYAAYCEERVAPVLSVGSTLPPGTRVVGLTVDVDARFRSDPGFHATDLLGLAFDHVVWTNYEAGLRYFPVHHRDAAHVPPAEDVGRVTEMALGWTAGDAAASWAAFLDTHGDRIDAIVMIGEPSPELLQETLDRADLRATEGGVRLFETSR